MLQARQLGKELYVGIHSDEAILENKGPTVMSLKERQVELSLTDEDSANTLTTECLPPKHVVGQLQ